MRVSGAKVGGQTADDTPMSDVLTVSAMAVVAYLLASFTHEGLGHGLAALIVGAPIQHVTSLDLVADLSHLSSWGARFVDAAGCLAQFALAAILYPFFQRTPSGQPNRRYFLWLLTYINILIPAGYLMALSFAPFGDWNDFVQGLGAQVVWRAAFTLIGLAISLATIFRGARDLAPFVGSEAQGRWRRALGLTLIPYFVGSAVSTLAGAFNPDGAILVLTSAAAATFGGTICLFWIGFTAAQIRPLAELPAKPLRVARGGAWLAAGVVALLIYFVVLGPGIPRG